MSAPAEIVRPSGGSAESWVIGAVVAVILLVTGIAVRAHRVDDTQPRLFDWQVSAFYDLNATDQAVYNALSASSEDLWASHEVRRRFSTVAEYADPWPTMQQLKKDELVPPFVEDAAWIQQGQIQWERVASFSFEGSTVYFGSRGKAPKQSAYLLVLSHVHKGASYTNGAAVWVHPDPNVAAPKTLVRDSLIVNGWKEVVPYSGAMEVERLKGG